MQAGNRNLQMFLAVNVMGKRYFFNTVKAAGKIVLSFVQEEGGGYLVYWFGRVDSIINMYLFRVRALGELPKKIHSVLPRSPTIKR